MYYTGIDPFTNKPVQSAKNLRDRKMQRALMQFFKPENYFEVREALIQAGRTDLIGGCEGLIAGQPPKEAIEARRRQANALRTLTTTTPFRIRRRTRVTAPVVCRRHDARSPGRGPKPQNPTGE
jgi:hypothetical protein